MELIDLTAARTLHAEFKPPLECDRAWLGVHLRLQEVQRGLNDVDARSAEPQRALHKARTLAASARASMLRMTIDSDVDEWAREAARLGLAEAMLQRMDEEGAFKAFASERRELWARLTGCEDELEKFRLDYATKRADEKQRRLVLDQRAAREAAAVSLPHDQEYFMGSDGVLKIRQRIASASGEFV